MNSTTGRRDAGTQSGPQEVYKFFLLVFVMAVPFYVLGALFGKKWARVLPITLPLAALMFFVPGLAAAIRTGREEGAAGVKALLARAVDARRIGGRKRWLLPTLGLWPALMLLEYGLLRATGAALPAFQFPPALVPVFLAAFFVAGVGEEVGWTAYATDRLQGRYTALQAALIIGVVGAALHVPADLQADRGLSWIAWQRLGSIVLRVLTVWLYNNTGKSTFAAILFHDTVNVGDYMFPNYGSHYDPFLALVLSAVVAAIVVALWGPATLARFVGRRVSD